MDEDLKKAIEQIKAYEAAASPGPWTAAGHDLWLGNPGPLATRYRLGIEDARLIAVQRTWLMRIIAALEAAEK